MPEKPITASSIARMAGNIAAGLVSGQGIRYGDAQLSVIAEQSVKLARLIAAEIERANSETPL